MKYLLVGGTNDGERVELPQPLTKLEMIKRVNFLRLPILAEREAVVSLHKELYVLQPWRAGEYEFEVYAIDGMKPHEQFQQLISGYMPKQRSKYA